MQFKPSSYRLLKSLKDQVVLYAEPVFETNHRKCQYDLRSINVALRFMGHIRD